MFTEDFTVFFNTSEHATAATYQGASINGIFENQFVEINGIESSRPTYLTTVVDVPDNPHGNTIVINAINYKIVGHQPDGTGLILLVLEKV